MNTQPTFLARITTALIDAREHAVRRRIRQHLRGLSDRQLEDMGFSRALLEQGSKAWPWRESDDLHGGSNLAAAMRARRTQGAAQPADYVHGATAPVDFPIKTDDKLAA